MIDGNLLKYNWKNKRFVVLDSETNGLNLFHTLPFNIGIQVYQNNSLIENHDLYIKWDNYQIRPDLAEKVHYDTVKIEKDGKSPKEILDILLSYLQDERNSYIGNNIINYDCMIFHNYAKKLGVYLGYSWLNRLYDNNAIFKGMKLEAKPSKESFLAWQFSMSNTVRKGLKSSVGFACKEFGIEYDKEAAHSALYDCDKSWKIFLELIKRVDLQ